MVVIFGGNPYATPWLNDVAALVHCWYLGSESGTALTNVLTGKTCPSGKLPVTFAKSYEDYPYVKYGIEAYPGKDKQVHYKEDVFVGYRGFDRDKRQPQFPFGFGLSYTTFSFSKPDVQLDGDNINVAVTIQNTGRVAGKEVAQVYIAAPKSKLMEKPEKELKAFAKTRLLQPGEQQTLQMMIPRQRLASWNETTHQWVVDNGVYTVMVGGNKGKLKIEN